MRTGVYRLAGCQVLVSFVLLATNAHAQLTAQPIDAESPYKNSVGVGGSLGTVYTKDADFWGLTADYARILNPSWGTAVSLAFDRETDRPDGKPKEITDTFSLVWTASYSLSSKFSLTTGVAKGVANDDNPEKQLEFTSGDWGTGIAVGAVLPGLPGAERTFGSFGCAWEWNISQREPSVSCDIALSFGF